MNRIISMATKHTDLARLILLQCVMIVVGGQIFLSVIGHPALADPALTVVLKPLVQVEDGTMTLENIAQVFGSDSTGAARLRRANLGRAPALGQTRTVTQDDIIRYCLRAGIKREDVEVTGAAQAVVSRLCDNISPEALSQVIEQYLDDNLTSQGVRYTWKYNRPPEPISIPVGSSIEVAGTTDSEIRGSVLLHMGLRQDGPVEPAFSIRIDVTTYQRLWTAKQAIPRGTLITNDVVQPREVETTWLVGNPCTQVESIIGYRATRTISKDRVITTDLIDIPYAVKRGDLVKISSFGDGVIATVDGQARQNGRPGDWIWVANLLTRGKMKAQVVDEHSVVIP